MSNRSNLRAKRSFERLTQGKNYFGVIDLSAISYRPFTFQSRYIPAGIFDETSKWRRNFDFEKALKNVKIFRRRNFGVKKCDNISTSKYSYVLQRFFDVKISTPFRHLIENAHWDFPPEKCYSNWKERETSSFPQSHILKSWTWPKWTKLTLTQSYFSSIMSCQNQNGYLTC